MPTLFLGWGTLPRTIKAALRHLPAPLRACLRSFLGHIRPRAEAGDGKRRGVVIEPFAGSACYSVRWNVENVFLYDVSEEIVYLWDWLMNCSDDDVRKIPAMFEDFDEILSLPKGAQTRRAFRFQRGWG